MSPTVTGLVEAEQSAPPEQQQSEVKGPSSSFSEHQKELLLDFAKAKISSERIIKDWSNEEQKTEQRRLTRDVDIDVKQLQAEGKLDEDETIIPVRVIDTNIQREQPPYINYLKNSRRLGIFSCVTKPDTITTALELEFTRVLTYIGWETPHFKCLDGAQTHGWDAIEVVFDSSKPGKVALEQVGHNMLYFPRKGKDIQDSSEVIRAYDVTVLQLKGFVDSFGFSDEQVGLIVDAVKDKPTEADNIRIYKRYKKFEGKVYVSWFCLKYGTRDWLKDPAPHFIGIKHKETQTIDVPTQQPDQFGNLVTVNVPTPQEMWVDTPLTLYPIFILPYRETEKPMITDHKGRVFYDENKQEAQTAVLSSFVNGITRASNIYGAMNAEDGSGSSLKELENIRITPGRIFNKPLTFWHTDYPDPMVLRSLQYFDTANSQEMNQPNFAVLNREDSRKTAKEIGAAQSEKTKLDSVQLTLFSTHIRSIYSFAWLIVQSQALQGKILFLQVKTSQPKLGIDNQPMIGPDGQPVMDEVWNNDIETISQTYDVRAAGDVDVIQKEEKIAQMQNDWPVISSTVLKDRFLADMLRLKYPDTGNEYAKILESQGGQFEQMKGLLGHLSNIVMGMMKDNPQMMQTLPPDQQQALQQMIQQSAALTQPAQLA